MVLVVTVVPATAPTRRRGRCGVESSGPSEHGEEVRIPQQTAQAPYRLPSFLLSDYIIFNEVSEITC